MASYSNTNPSNTNNRNIKKQQYQKAVASNVDDDVILEKMKKSITAFYPSLLKDDAWQNLYLENKNEKFEKFIGNVKSQEFLGNIVRYIVNIKDHLLILDTLHEADKKIYSSNEEITFYLDAEKIKFL